jgi:hypothetical protein
MILDFLFKRKKKQDYRLFLRGEEVVRENPLPALAPELFAAEPPDNYAGLEVLLDEMERGVAWSAHLLRMQQEKARQAYMHNIEQILRIPTIYAMMLTLHQRGLNRVIRNCHALATVFQACACIGHSEIVTSLRDDLMQILLGIYARYYGIQFVKPDECQAFLKPKRLDLDDPSQAKKNENFIHRYRVEADRFTDLSMRRFAQSLGQIDMGDPLTKETARGVIHIVRYTNWLHGAGALEYKRSTENEIHQYASYLAVLHHVLAEQTATGKRLCVCLAEEFDESRIHHKEEAMEKSARHNTYAINDFLAAHRCKVLEFFQGKDQTGIYCAPEKLYVRKVNVKSKGAMWTCFKSTRVTHSMADAGSLSHDIKHNVHRDPADEDLELVSRMMPEQDRTAARARKRTDPENRNAHAARAAKAVKKSEAAKTGRG